MKIVFISDIHSNFEYLTTVLEKIDKLSVDKIYCLGDLINYYDKPNEVIDLIRKKQIQCIKGNHDKYLLSELPYKQERGLYYGIQRHLEIIRPDNIDYLKSLPDDLVVEHKSYLFYLTHSLPGNCETYLTELDQLDREFINKYDFYCYGHTHRPLITSHYGTTIINPGAVGQPRDYSKQASFALIDLQENNQTIIRVTVDHNNYCNNLTKQNYPSLLIDILNRDKNEN